MRSEGNIFKRIDWITVLIYLALVIFGWMNIYSVSGSDSGGMFSLSTEAGRQAMWFGITIIMVIVIFSIDFKFFNTFAYIIYGVSLLALIAVLFLARDIQGAQSWIELGPVRFQPSEFAKFSCSLALAKFFDKVPPVKWDPPFHYKTYLQIFTGFQFPQPYTMVALILGAPMLLILLQGDAGSALIFIAFVIALYREGMPTVLPALAVGLGSLFIVTLLPSIEPFDLIIGLLIIAVLLILFLNKTVKNILLVFVGFLFSVGVVLSVDWVVDNGLQAHQKKRIEAFIDAESDPKGAGWNIINSKKAIASGGFSGTGYLDGRFTQLDWVFAKSTDFIFATVAEEHGWVGSIFLIGLYVALLFRVLSLSERQKSKFARMLGYCVVSLIFFHFAINVGMTMGLAPVIGIPLPFFSYGGSSLMAFSLLLFTFLKQDAHRMEVLVRS